jgi:hypothetical protein
MVWQFIAWSISIGMHFFEYHKALGHIWYVHAFFWWYSVVFYAFQEFAHLNSNLQFKSLLVIEIIVACQAFLSLTLAVLAIIYPKDERLDSRYYISIYQSLSAEDLEKTT